MIVRTETISYVLPRRHHHETRRLPSAHERRHQRGIGSVRTRCGAYKDMMDELHDFVPKTKMAEQEFLSYYWGRSGDWHAMHKKYNFQIHQLYFASPEAPPGQDRQSSFAYMVDHPQEIRVFHFSADQKPSDILINAMSSVQGWLTLEDHLKEHARYMMEQHGSRNPALHNHPEWIDKIEKLLRYAQKYDTLL